MNEDTANGAPEKSLFERIGRAFSQTPRNSEDVADMLRSAENESIIDASVLQIMEGALKVSDQQAREIMIPRSQMVIIDDDFSLEQVLKVVISSQHSRFPVVGESSDDIKGILLAKEMLPLLLSGNDYVVGSQMLYAEQVAATHGIDGHQDAPALVVRFSHFLWCGEHRRSQRGEDYAGIC